MRIHKFTWQMLWAGLALTAVAFFYLNRYFWVDDTFITLRYAHNILMGKGPVYNPGEWVEGYTSPLFLLLVSVLGYLGVGLESAARALSLSGWLALAWAVWREGKSRYQSSKAAKPAVYLLAILGLCSYPAVSWAVSGMETTCFTALLFIALMKGLAFIREEKSFSHAMLVGLAMGGAYLFRPEAPLFAAMLVIYMMGAGYLRREWRLVRGALILAGVFGAIMTSFLLWRWHVYHDWLPNTYYAKMYGAKPASYYLRGLEYIGRYLKAPPFLFLYALAFFLMGLAQKKKNYDSMFLGGVIVAYLLYVVSAGGDWMEHFRLLVPVMPLLATVLVMGAVPLLEGMPQKWHARACVAALLLVWVQPYAYATKKPFQVAYWKEIAQHIQHHWPKHSLIAINMAGYIPYLTPEYRYLDMLGLNDRHISRRPVIFEGGLFTTGHFKGDGKYILARKPDYIIFGGGLEEKYLSFYLSEKELMALAEFHKSYQRKKVYLSLKNMDIPENKQGFFFYQRRP